MLEQLKKAHKLTLQLIEAVRNDELDKAGEIQQQRTTLLQSAEQSPLPENDIELKEIQEVTLSIKELETNLTRWLSDRKAEILNQHQDQKKRQTMVRAYKDIGG